MGKLSRHSLYLDNTEIPTLTAGLCDIDEEFPNLYLLKRVLSQTEPNIFCFIFGIFSCRGIFEEHRSRGIES